MSLDSVGFAMAYFKVPAVYSSRNQESLGFRNHSLIRRGTAAALPCSSGVGGGVRGICHCSFSGKIESHG